MLALASAARIPRTAASRSVKVCTLSRRARRVASTLCAAGHPRSVHRRRRQTHHLLRPPRAERCLWTHCDRVRRYRFSRSLPGLQARCAAQQNCVPSHADRSRLAAKAGTQVVVPYRDEDEIRILRVMGDLGQIVPLVRPEQASECEANTLHRNGTSATCSK